MKGNGSPLPAKSNLIIYKINISAVTRHDGKKVRMVPDPRKPGVRLLKCSSDGCSFPLRYEIEVYSINTILVSNSPSFLLGARLDCANEMKTKDMISVFIMVI